MIEKSRKWRNEELEAGNHVLRFSYYLSFQGAPAGVVTLVHRINQGDTLEDWMCETESGERLCCYFKSPDSFALADYELLGEGCRC